MPSKKLDGGLEALDKSDAPLRDLVDHAAKVLGVDLSQIPVSPKGIPDEKSASAYTFKEQWVLRWLTRRIALALEPGKNAKPGSSRNDNLFDSAPWRLVQHLLAVIPANIQSEILIERKFLGSLRNCIELYLEHGQVLPSAASDDGDESLAKRSTKRRRLSPNPKSKVAIGHGLDTDLLRICSQTASLVSYASNQSDQVRASFWSSVEDCASVLASSLSLALRTVSRAQSEDPSVFAHLISLICFWNGRPVAPTESAKANETLVFNERCLGLCLELLDALEETSQTPENQLQEASQTLERLLATTVVVPLRVRFVRKHLKHWRVQRPCLTWSVIEPVYRDFMVGLGASSPDRKSKAAVMADFEWREQAHRLYAIATKLLPRFDIRRKQQEQEWLDALLLVLGYASCPRLPQLSLTPGGMVEPIDAAYALEAPINVAGIEHLCRLVSFSHCPPSTQAVGYVAAAVSAWQDFTAPWSALACLLAVQTNILLPNTGVPTSTFALGEFVTRLEQSTIQPDQYDILKTGCMLPLLRAFSQSRALNDYALLWHDNLQEAMRLGSNSSEDTQHIAAVQVWQDEDVLDEFTRQVALSTGSSLGEGLLAELQSAMAELVTRIGSTLDVFAKIAIVSALLRAKGRTRPPSETATLSSLVDLAVSALGRRSDYQGQRWRLWSLINSIQKASADLLLPETLVDDNIEQAGSVSLGQLRADHTGIRGAQWYQECLEQFTVVTDEALKQNAPFVAAFNTSVEHLREVFGPSADPVDGFNSKFLWNGRSGSICDVGQLLTACVGVLLARPAILNTRSDLAEAVLGTFCVHSRGSKLSDSPANCTQVVSSAILEMTNAKTTKALRSFMSEVLGKDMTTITSDPRGQQMVESFLLPGLSPTSLRTIANTLYGRLSDPERQPGELARHLTIMDDISDRHQTEFIKAEALNALVTIGEHLGKAKPWSEPHSFFVIGRCLQNIMAKAWSSLLEISSTEKPQITEHVDEALAAVMKMKRSTSKARLPNELGWLYLTALIIRGAESTPSAANEATEELGAAFGVLLASDLRALVSSGLNDATCSQIAVLLDILTCDNKLVNSNEGLRSAIQELHSKATQEKSIAAPESTSLRDLILVQCITLKSHFRHTDRPVSVEATLKALSPAPQATSAITQRQLMETASEADVFVQSLSLESRAICLSLLSRPEVSMQLGVLRPLIVAAVTLQSSGRDLEEQPEIQSRLAEIGCLHGLEDGNDLHMLLFELENTKLILDTHPQAVGQATIDELLAQLTLVLSATGMNELTGMVQAALLFDRVCAIIGSLLSRFRRRLADRYHLLLPVLQQLVRWLFYSEDVVRRARQPTVIGSDPSSYLRSLPSWLVSASTSLPPSSAVNLSRLLSSICNPTVSAAKSSRRHGKSNELNDETKRVKAVASQHLQYLVMEYCRCSLDGDIAPAVKEKLLPGMYAVLDAMSRDLMRAMNAAMDPSSRAIFKTLYDDWSRYGKWDKS